MRRFAFRGQRHPYYLQDETYAYLARLSSRPRIDWIAALDAWIVRGKAFGWWQLLAANSAIYLYNTRGSINDCLVNVLSRKWCNGSLPGGALNPTWTPYIGIKGDGIQKYLLPGFKMGDMPLASASNYAMFGFNFFDVSSATFDWGASGGGAGVGIEGRIGSLARYESSASSTDSVSAATAVGMNVIRRAWTDHYLVNKGLQQQQFNRASVALPTSGVAVLKQGSLAATYAPAGLSMFGMTTDPTLIASDAMWADIIDATNQMFLAQGVITLDDLNPPAESIGANYWEPSSISQVTPAIRIFQTAPPPASDTLAAAATYARNPITDAGTNRIDLLNTSTWTLGSGQAWSWTQRSNLRTTLGANNCFPPIRTSDGRQGACEYDTVARANAATLSRDRWVRGRVGHHADGVSGYLDCLNAVGIPDANFHTWAAANAAPDAIFTGSPTNGNTTQNVALNHVVSHDGQLSTVARSVMRKGIIDDMEVADGRSEADLLALLLPMSAERKADGYESILWLNELTGANGRNESLNANTMWQLHQAYDLLSIMCWVGNSEHDIPTSIAAQLALLTGPLGDKLITYSKLMMTIGQPGALSDADAIVCHNYIAGLVVSAPAASGADKVFGASLDWPNFEIPGGALSRTRNQRLARCWGMSLV